MLDFKEITIEDYDLINEYAYKYGENSCQHSFVCWYTLKEKYNDKYVIKNDFLYILREKLCDEAYRVYLFPMGEGNIKEALEEIIKDAHERGKKVKFQTVTLNSMIKIHDLYMGKFEAHELRNYAEYLHLSSNLSLLPGKAFESKRYDVNLFRRTYADRLEEILMTKDMIPEILDFEEFWMTKSLEQHDRAALFKEYAAIKLQLSNYDKLKISGVVIKLDGKIQGFVYGAPLSDECYDVLIEKGNVDYNDIYRILHQDIVKLCAMDYKYINREEDVGVEGLRKAKMSYKPDILLTKFTLIEV